MFFTCWYVLLGTGIVALLETGEGQGDTRKKSGKLLFVN